MVNLLISINVDPSSKSCSRCKHLIAKWIPDDTFCCIGLSKSKTGKRGKLCLSAQKQAEELEAKLVKATELIESVSYNAKQGWKHQSCHQCLTIDSIISASGLLTTKSAEEAS